MGCRSSKPQAVAVPVKEEANGFLTSREQSEMPLGLIIPISMEEGNLTMMSSLAGYDIEDYFPEEPILETCLQRIEEYQKCEEMQLPKVCTYQGEWANNKQNGVGKMTYADSGVYTGFWFDGQASSFGKYIAGKNSAMRGSSYSGTFLNGRANGYGVFMFTDGSKYRGLFESDRRHGLGLEFHTDDLQYAGPYSMGKKNGIGRLKSPNGEYYVGEFQDNEISGYGVYRWPDGRIYEGHWNYSVQEGHAKFTWPDGRIYIGNYSKGKINGKGCLVWPDGRRYDGQWKNGLQEGKGDYYKDPQHYRSATFVEGVRTRWETNFITSPKAVEMPFHDYPGAFKGLNTSSVASMDQWLMSRFIEHHNLEVMRDAVHAGKMVGADGVPVAQGLSSGSMEESDMSD